MSPCALQVTFYSPIILDFCRFLNIQEKLLLSPRLNPVSVIFLLVKKILLVYVDYKTAPHLRKNVFIRDALKIPRIFRSISRLFFFWVG
jgi:hypothetical protein